MTHPQQKQGLVVLVGAGPGDVGLITAAGLRWLSRAEVIIYDRLVNPALLELAPESAQRIYVGKTPRNSSTPQERINQLMISNCLAGKLVIRLKGGDPLIFARGGEEVEALVQAGVRFRIFPGITAATAAGSYAGIPLTDRRFASSVVFATGHENPSKPAPRLDYHAIARIDTVVFYMPVAHLRTVTQKLIAAGKDPRTPAALVENAATPKQRTLVATLSTIAKEAEDQDISHPAVLIVGEVVRMRERMAWLEDLPLFGRSVLVTRARREGSKLSARLIELGANVIEAPTIIIGPLESYREVDDALRRLDRFDWLVLTSSNGVKAMLDRMEKLDLDARALSSLRIAAIGPGTADALRDKFVHPDLIPRQFTSKALARAMQSADQLEGKRILLPRTDLGTRDLPEALIQSGAAVAELVIYRTTRPPALPADAVVALNTGAVDWITFTSSSTVENFLALADLEQMDLFSIKLAAIGPVTAETLIARGLKPAVVADPHTIDALAAAIASYETGPP